MLNLQEVAQELARRLSGIFLPDATGRRPCHGDEARYAADPHWKELVLFYEYFHGDTGRGVGANHQTGWTALAVRLLDQIAKARDGEDTNLTHHDGMESVSARTPAPQPAGAGVRP
jgi:hypothetical protein